MSFSHRPTKEPRSPLFASKLEMSSQTGSVRVLIAEDHKCVRDGLRDILSLAPDLEVIGEASSGREALELTRSLRPDVVLMDVRMPEMDGIAATREIKREHPVTAVLILTMYHHPDYMLEALRAGAAGYILKDSPAMRLINAVRRTSNRESPLDQELAADLLRRVAEERNQTTPEP
jgi:DNA-binding NarL/FixJ family response regulator